MAEKPNREFGRRTPVAIQTTVPVKRSSHVALLLMGTFAIGGGAYALMPGENCGPIPPGMAAPSGPQANAECTSRGSSPSGGHGSSGGSSGTSSDSGSGGVTRGGFGGFAHAFTSHFSSGG
jgi:hypothetical protein